MVSTPKSPYAIIAKVAIDQLLFAPFCTLLFYAFKTITESRPAELLRELDDKFLPTVLAGGEGEGLGGGEGGGGGKVFPESNCR